MKEKKEMKKSKKKGEYINHLKSTKIWILTMGALALVWFLIRVIPKPSRASYPCQRVAFPMATAFIIWLISTGSTIFSVKWLRYLFKEGKLIYSFIFMVVTVIFLITSVIGSQKFLMADPQTTNAAFVPSEPLNSPMGVSRGIYPGRVVWVHDTASTSWDGMTGYWWEDSNTDIKVVSEMLSKSLLWLTGMNSDSLAWNAIFHHFNNRRGNGDTGYQTGEKVAIKLNMNNCGTHGQYKDNRSNSSPQVVLALIRQLVNHAGVPDSCITCYDKSRQIPSNIYNTCINEFPGIHFMDDVGGEGRKKFVKDVTCQVSWSEDLTLENGGGYPTYLPKSVSEASYIINLGNLKGHDLAGVTVCAKNHVGSIISESLEKPSHSSPKAAGIHPYCTVHEFHHGGHWDFDARPMGTYNTLVDLMGHKDLGEKTLLFLIDALYAAQTQHDRLETKNQWSMEPFNNDWTSSLFISQDGVALESVGLDFLRSEPSQTQVYGAVDNYLHEAAMANDPPSGTFYCPDGDGVRLASLGVHEHWNNSKDKKYSRNMGLDEGIELISDKYAVPDPYADIKGGVFFEEKVVLLSCELEEAEIYYTVDGDIPDRDEIKYVDGVPISENTILTFRAFHDTLLGSGIYREEYTLKVPDPEFSMSPGEYEQAVELEISCNNDEARIYYTLDGTIPDVNSILYSEPLLIENDVTIKVKAIRNNWESSEIVEGEYIIDNINNMNSFAQGSLLIYPNPAGNYVHIVSEEPLNSEMRIDIVDFSGKNIKHIESNTAKNRILLDELNTGIYYLKIEINGKEKIRSLIKY